MDDTRVILRGVGLTIPVYESSQLRFIRRRGRGAVESQIHDKKRRALRIQALDGIDLEIPASRRVALIGANGAGKSSLMRIIAGIYSPTIGDVEIRGSTSPIIVPDTGFMPEATGYENLHLRFRLMGLTEQQVPEAFAKVEEISELGRSLHVPIRTYSQGMLNRLGLASILAVPVDILLLDEPFNTLDRKFLRRFEKYFQEYTRPSTIMVLTSHREQDIRQYAQQGVVLDRGRVRFQGDIDEALAFYREDG